MKIWKFSFAAFSVLLLFTGCGSSDPQEQAQSQDLQAAVRAGESVLAGDYYWVGGSGAWEDESNWNPFGPPDDVAKNMYIINNGKKPIDITYNTTYEAYYQGYTNLYIGSPGTGKIVFTQGNANQSNYLSELKNIIISGDTTYNQLSGVINLGTGILTIEEGSKYLLSGGSLWPDSMVINGIFIQKGGFHSPFNLYININLINHNATYEMQDGNYWAVGATVNNGTLNQSGGVMTFDILFNRGIINLSGGQLLATGPSGFPYGLQNDGLVNISGKGAKTIDFESSGITNNGTINVTKAIVYCNGPFINNGVYIADRATQYFTDLIIGQNGYLVGKKTDVFKISGDLLSESTMNNDWNTGQSYLQFITGIDSIHDFYLTGADFGSRMPDAYNFAWGVLDVTGNIVHFYDGNNEAGAALYLREIVGLDINDMLIANLFGFDGLNIYYLANLPGNHYLHGLTYDLVGGGLLRPVPNH